MKTLITTLVAALLSVHVMAQDEPTTSGLPTQDTITIRSGFGGTKYAIDGRSLNKQQLSDILRTSDNARPYADAAKTFRLVSALSGCLGGALLGYQVANNLTSGTFQMPFLYVSGALVGLSIATGVTASNNIRRGARAYNDEMRGGVSKVQPQLQVGFGGNGVGLALRF
ncbi:MAG TPA: hypothetical protein VIN07_13715 [Flavipsychrobacter sp.]